MNAPNETTNATRQKKSKQKTAVLVTTLLPHELPPLRRRGKAGIMAAVLAVGLMAAPYMLLAKSEEANAAEKTTIVQASVPAGMVAPKPHHMRGKTVNAEPSGIALPADSQAATVEDAAPSTETAKPAKPKKENAVSPKPAKRKAVAKKPPAKDDEIIEKDAKRPRLTGYMSEAYTQIEKQNFAGAVELYDKALDKDENNADAWKGKAFALQQMETPEAVAELREMTEQRPQSPVAYAALSQILAGRGEREQALKPLERAVELDPKNDTYRANLAILHERLGHDKEALELYKQIKKPPYAIKQRIDALTAQPKQQ